MLVAKGGASGDSAAKRYTVAEYSIHVGEMDKG